MGNFRLAALVFAIFVSIGSLTAHAQLGDPGGDPGGGGGSCSCEFGVDDFSVTSITRVSGTTNVKMVYELDIAVDCKDPDFDAFAYIDGAAGTSDFFYLDDTTHLSQGSHDITLDMQATEGLFSLAIVYRSVGYVPPGCTPPMPAVEKTIVVTFEMASNGTGTVLDIGTSFNMLTNPLFTCPVTTLGDIDGRGANVVGSFIPDCLASIKICGFEGGCSTCAGGPKASEIADTYEVYAGACLQPQNALMNGSLGVGGFTKWDTYGYVVSYLADEDSDGDLDVHLMARIFIADLGKVFTVFDSLKGGAHDGVMVDEYGRSRIHSAKIKHLN